MGRIRIFPGAIEADRLRALVVAQPDAEIALRKRSDGTVVAFDRERPLSQPDRTRTAAEFPGLDVFLVEARNLDPGAEYVLLAQDSSPASAGVVIRTLPRRIGPEGLVIAVASCFYPWFPTAAAYGSALSTKHFGPIAFKMLIGDNLYADIGPLPRGRD